MKTKKDIYLKLKAYSLLSVSYLAVQQEAGAQVIYTDIEPDTILDERTELFWADIDANGTLDFGFINSSFTYFNYDFASYHTVQDLLAGPYSPMNEIAGIYNTISSSTYIYFPYALEKYDEVRNDLSWQNWGIQFLALRVLYHYGADILIDCNNCYWYNDTVPAILDHYLGIRFIDEESQTHYGWIRCDVKDEGRTLVIKDYAYEVQHDNPILAGDTVHYVPVHEHENTLEAVAYSFGKNIYIQTAEENITATIYEMSGRKIVEQMLQENSSVINMKQYTAGLYIITLRNDEKVFSKKVIVE